MSREEVIPWVAANHGSTEYDYWSRFQFNDDLNTIALVGLLWNGSSWGRSFASGGRLKSQSNATHKLSGFGKISAKEVWMLFFCLQSDCFVMKYL